MHSLLWYWVVLLKRLICILDLVLQFAMALWISLKLNDAARKWKNIYIWIFVWRKCWPTIIMLSARLYAPLICSHLYISMNIFLSFPWGNISWSNWFIVSLQWGTRVYIEDWVQPLICWIVFVSSVGHVMDMRGRTNIAMVVGVTIP